MTCIAAIADGNAVWIGGDSAGVSGWSVTVRADAKVFGTGPFVMGFTGSFRMGQLLRHRLICPLQEADDDTERFMVVTFVDAVRRCLSDGGWKSTSDGREEGGTFLVGYRGELYVVHGDFQVAKPADQVGAVGCGDDLALGALDALAGHLPPRERILRALNIASHRSGGVCAPFHVVTGGFA